MFFLLFKPQKGASFQMINLNLTTPVTDRQEVAKADFLYVGRKDI